MHIVHRDVLFKRNHFRKTFVKLLGARGVIKRISPSSGVEIFSSQIVYEKEIFLFATLFPFSNGYFLVKKISLANYFSLNICCYIKKKSLFD